MREYLYRAAPELNEGEDILCKNAEDNTNIVDFIVKGSKEVKNPAKAMKTKFISTSKLIGVVINKHTLGMKGRKDGSFKGILKNGELVRGKRAPVILVDMTAIRKREKEVNKNRSKDNKETYIYDCSTSEDMEKINIMEEEKQGRKWKNAKDFANSDKEVIIKYCIRNNEYKQIPPVLVDVLDAFEQINNEDSKLCMQAINDIIMESSRDENDKLYKIMNTIENMQFNEFEKYIITEYYQNMNAMYQIKENCEQFLDEKERKKIELLYNNRDIMLEGLTAIKAEIIRKIISNKEIQEIIEAQKKKIQKENGIKETTTDYGRIIKEYYVIPEGVVAGMTSQTQAEVLKGTNGKRPEYNAFIGRPNIRINVNKNKPLFLPIGIKCIKKAEMVTYKAIYKILAKGENFTQNGILYGDTNTSPKIQRDYYGTKYLLREDNLELPARFLDFLNKNERNEGKNALEDNMKDEHATESFYQNARRNVVNEVKQENNREDNGISNEDIGEIE